MHPESEQGYFLLADISGFDAYLAGVELDHANDVTAELLELIVNSLSPPLQIAGIHRDAVLAYQEASRMPRGETMLELAEAGYVTFRDRLKSIERNNTCDCKACLAIPSLDLKFLVHFGRYAIQPGLDGRVMLGGLDAGLVRERRLKDQVPDGARSYALFTEASLSQMGVRPDGMEPLRGEYDHLGEVRAASLDLGHRYQQLTEARLAYVSAGEADVIVSHDFASPPALVWEWLNDPQKRSIWFRWTKWRPGLRPAGRTGVGAVNHCSHGIGSVVETVLDWRPYRYYTVNMTQESIWSSLDATYQLDPLPEGADTRVQFHARLLRAPSLRVARPALKHGYSRKVKQDFERMGALMAAEAAAAEAAAAEAAAAGPATRSQAVAGAEPEPL